MSILLIRAQIVGFVRIDLLHLPGGLPHKLVKILLLFGVLVDYLVNLLSGSFLTNAELLAHQHLLSSLLFLDRFEPRLRNNQIPVALVQHSLHRFTLLPSTVFHLHLLLLLLIVGLCLEDGEIGRVGNFLLHFPGQGDQHGAFHFWLIAEDVFDGVLGDFAFRTGEGLLTAVVRVGDLPGGSLCVVTRIDQFDFTAPLGATLFNLLLLQLFCGLRRFRVRHCYLRVRLVYFI